MLEKMKKDREMEAEEKAKLAEEIRYNSLFRIDSRDRFPETRFQFAG